MEWIWPCGKPSSAFQRVTVYRSGNSPGSSANAGLATRASNSHAYAGRHSRDARKARRHADQMDAPVLGMPINVPLVTQSAECNKVNGHARDVDAVPASAGCRSEPVAQKPAIHGDALAGHVAGGRQAEERDRS